MSLLLTLLSSSTEILVKVLQSCATIQDMIALAAACRHLHSVLAENCGQIIWLVGNRSILCFDDALIAIRATQIVKETQSSSQLPPKPFLFKLLGGAFHKPTLEELEHVCNLQHMVRCIEHMLFNWEMEDCEFKILQEFIDFDELEEYGWNSWKQNFYRSMYRVIHAGCVCSRAYTEPFYQAAMKGDIAFFDRWQRRVDPTATGRMSSFKALGKDIEYLRRWPVYNFDAEDQTEIGEQRDRELEDWFGPFAEWLVSDGRSRDGRMFTNPGVHSDDPPFLFQSDNGCDDILRLLAAYEHFTRKIACGDGRNYYGRLNWDSSNPPTISGRVRKVNVVLFGVFQVEEITMPARVEDSAGLYLIANPLPGAFRRIMGLGGDNMVKKLWTSYCLDISMVLAGLRRASTRPNYHNGYPAPDGILQFFIFSLRKHFGKTIDQRSFEVSVDAAYRSLAEPSVFIEPSQGRVVLVEYNIPEYSRDDRF